MGGISREDYLKQMLESKAEREREFLHMSPTEKLRIWQNMMKNIRWLKTGKIVDEPMTKKS